MPKFLCACKLEQKLAYGYKAKKDGEGFSVCPEHGEREEGWRTKADKLAGRING